MLQLARRPAPLLASFSGACACLRCAQPLSSSLRCSASCPGFGRRQTLQLLSAGAAAPQLPGQARSVVMASSGGDKQPENFAYTHLWVDKDGETHLRECSMTGFDLKQYAKGSPPQFVREGEMPKKVVFSELEPGNRQEMHSAPEVQFVVCLSGSWYVETTDGDRKDFKVGEVLFQDDVEASPAANTPQHASGVNGEQPNQQLILQVDKAPQVDKPGEL